MKTNQSLLALLFASFAIANLFAQPALVPDLKFQVKFSRPAPYDAWTWLASPEGGIVLSGGFDSVRGTETSGTTETSCSLVRLHPDGSIDTRFKPEIGAIRVTSLVGFQSGNRLLFLGSLGLTRVYRLDAQGRLDPTFNAPTDVTGILTTLPDDRLIAYRAALDTSQNAAESELIRLNPDGGIDGTFRVGVRILGDQHYLGRLVRTVVPLPDGKLFIGGSFTNVSGKLRRNVARLNADGTLDEAFDSTKAIPPPGWVEHIVVQSDGRILVEGPGSEAVYGVTRLNPDGTVDPSFAPMFPREADEQQISLTLLVSQPGGNITIWAYYILENNSVSRWAIIRLHLDGSLADTIRLEGSPPEVEIQQSNAQLVPDDKIMVHDFHYLAGIPHSRLVRMNADWSVDRTFQEVVPEVSAEGEIDTLVRSGDKLILSGSFSSLNGHFSPGIARLNSDGTVDRSFAADAGIPRMRFTPRGNDGGWTAVGTIAALPDGKLLLHGVRDTRLVRLKADGGLDNSFRSAIPVGPALGLWFGSDSWPAGMDRPILGVQSDGRILVQKTDDGRLVRLGLDGSVDPGFSPVFTGGDRPDSPFSALAVQSDNRIVGGGSFTQVNGVARQGLARLNPDGTLDASFDAFGSALPDPNEERVISRIVPDANGGTLVGGRFGSWLGTDTARGIVRLNPDGSLDKSFLADAAHSFTDPTVGLIQVQSDRSLFLIDAFLSHDVQQDSRMGVVFGGGGGDGFQRYQFVPVFRQPRWTPGLPFTTTLGLFPGVPHRIEASSDLVNWQTVTTVTNPTENIPFTDPEAATVPRRFYRALQVNP